MRLPLLLLFLALPLQLVAQRSNVQHGGGGCWTDWDCSLGGTCGIVTPGNAGTCKCDPQFTGPTCALLNLQAVTDDQLGLCHKGFDSYSSWGGRAIPESGAEDAKWHLYASFMCNHNDLGAWTTASSTGHFIGDSAIGPFKWSPEQCEGAICTPVITPWSHNTVATHNEAVSGDQSWQIWHIGNGTVEPEKWAPCFNFSEVGVGTAGLREQLDATQRVPPASDNGTRRPDQYIFVSEAASPNGPWTKTRNNQPLIINYPPAPAWPQGATNPSPLEMPDGSVHLYFTHGGRYCGLVENCVGLAISKNGYEGPFEPLPEPITYPESEDPTVFRDTRGNYHMLTNVNTGHHRCQANVECGGHAWSTDGITFSNLTIGAFGPTFTFANGTIMKNSYSERPLVTTSEDGTPLALYVGLGRGSYADSCNFPMLFCTGAAGEICGPTLQPN